MVSPHRSPRSSFVGRRAFLAGAGASLVLASCGSSTSGVASEDTGPSFEGTGGDDGPRFALQAGFADGVRTPWTPFEAGQRARGPYFLFGANAVPVVNGLPESLTGTLTAPDGRSIEVEMARHDSGVPTPYFLLDFAPSVSGVHEFVVDVDGGLQASEFFVAEAGAVTLVQPGQPMRPLDTPTVDDARGFDPICTRFDPCPFHEYNLADVIQNGRPTVLLIATPGFCQTSICGPSVELLIELGPDDGIDVIHAEVYTTPFAAEAETGLADFVGPVLGAYGMEFEPSFIVADARGIVTARLDFAFDRTEMAAAIATV